MLEAQGRGGNGCISAIIANNGCIFAHFDYVRGSDRASNGLAPKGLGTVGGSKPFLSVFNTAKGDIICLTATNGYVGGNYINAIRWITPDKIYINILQKLFIS